MNRMGLRVRLENKFSLGSKIKHELSLILRGFFIYIII